jgi:MGT family glycosyltransferase
VRASGCEFSPWTTAPHRTTRDRSGDIVRDYEWTNPLVMIRNYLHDFLGEPAPRWAADTRSELEQRPVDAVVAEFSLPATLIPVEQLGIPCAAIVPNIWVLPTPGIPPVGPGFAPARGPIGWTRDAIVRALVRRAFVSALPPINAVRRDYGLDPLTSVHDQMMRADQVLVLTSPAFDITSPDMPEHVYYTGPQLDEPAWAARWESPWPADDRRPLVLVGLSSTFQNQVAVLRNIVAALSTLPVRAVLTLGPALHPSEVPAGDNVHVVATAPHNVLLQEASAMITHCGHGSTMKALAAGVPLICMPMGRDQNDTAARVVFRGAGVRLKPSTAPEKIAAATVEVLANPKYREGARRLAHAIATGEGCIDPIDALERLAAHNGASMQTG